jgi:toxin ParE1/3/4
MGYKVILGPQAIADLQNIVCYIARDNPAAALRVGNALLDRTMILESFPELGAPYRSYPGVRRLTLRPYQVFYRVNDSQHCIEVMRYWHPAQGDVPL